MTSHRDFAGHTPDSIGDPQESNTYPTLNVRSKLGIFKYQSFFVESKINQFIYVSIFNDHDNETQRLEPSLVTALSQLMRPGRISGKCLLEFFVWINLFSPETGKFDWGVNLRMS